MKQMRSQIKRKRKITKAKIIRLVNGSISIMLCLLLTPFLSVAVMLVEYARYQQAMELTNEIYELSGASVLSDYDTYIHNRFGLLVTTQEHELGDGCQELFYENMHRLLGKQASAENVQFAGTLSLDDARVLKRQIIDYSELTVPTAFIADDLDLESLIERLQGVKEFQSIIHTVSGLSDLTDALCDAVDAVKMLKNEIENLKNRVESLKLSGETLANKIADLYNDLKENGITLPKNATAEEIEAALDSFCDSYEERFKEVINEGYVLSGQIDGIKLGFDSVKNAADQLKAAVKKANDVADSIVSTNEADKDGNISKGATRTLGDILSEMNKLVNETLVSIKDDAITAAKNTVRNIIDESFEQIGIKDFVGRYRDIVYGDYFALPLSATAKDDLSDFLKNVKETCENNGDLKKDLLEFFKSKFIPDIKIDFEGLVGDIDNIIENASTALSENIKEKGVSLLTDLVNIVNRLFDLDIFYDSDLNANLELGVKASSPYQDFLNAIGKLKEAINEFTESINKWNIWDKIIGGLRAAKKMFSSIGDMLNATFRIISGKITTILSLGNQVASGDVRELYERFLISGYMKNNLPSRVNAGKYVSTYADGVVSYKIELNGEGITPMKFGDIARPAKPGLPGFYAQDNLEEIGKTLNNLGETAGTDKMFYGAELEYISAGTRSEIANQIMCFLDIYFFRLLLDLPAIFLTDTEVAEVASLASIASWVVYILYVILEPFCDTVYLVNSNDPDHPAKIPLIKTKCWLTPSGVGDFINGLANETMDAGLINTLGEFTNGYFSSKNDSTVDGVMPLSYQSHLMILLFLFVDEDDQIARLSDLIRMESAEHYRQQGKNFSMKETYSVVDVSADVRFDPVFDIGSLNGGKSILPARHMTVSVSY